MTGNGRHHDTRKAVARANEGFYRVFERMDPVAMRAVWLDSPCIRCVHPGGEILAGPMHVHASWEAIFRATRSVRIELTELEIAVEGDAAWVCNVEHVHTTWDGGKQDSLAAATNVYVLRGGAWRMTVHHASPIARRFFPE